MSEPIKSKVSVSIGRTINTGDFSSVRCDFGLACEIATTKEEAIKEEFKRILHLVVEQTNTFTRTVPGKKSKKKEDE